MEFWDVLEKRQSVRSYLPRPVEPELLDRILEAGRLSPSARNRQEWKFYVLPVSDKNRAAILDAVNEQTHPPEAPLLLAVCSTEERMMNCGQSAAVIDPSIALAYMMLAAADAGLGTCWIGNFDADKMKAIFSIPEEYRLVAVTPLGYPNGTPERRPRKPISEVAVKYIR